MFHEIAARQLWTLPTRTQDSTPAHCTPFTLPSNGVIQLGDASAITLTNDVVFQPECTGTTNGEVLFTGHLKDPFYASTIPMVYVISAATVIAWVLVVMLTITPRTSFFGVPTSSQPFGGGHGIIGGANGGSVGLVGSGSRPWLQKVATIAVAISLTIATADTLEVAERQYYKGYMDAESLRKQVLGSLEIRITRVVSDIFLWLAQVQTLIRLFPRHKEKVLIKWIGFVLIILDTIFSCLNSFLINSTVHGRRFLDAIPALSYLFELALGLLYAAWVMYYSLTKRQYAFYHPKMRSILLIAVLGLVSILTPVVFFVTDVSNQDVAGWGDYFRWVGAAAASVVVWEWVDRIEALERDDKKDGILGREIFEGDEMLDVMPTEASPWSESRALRRNFRRRLGGGGDDAGGGNEASAAEHGLSGVGHQFHRSRHQQSPQHFPLGRAHSSSLQNSSSDHQGQPGLRSNTVTFDEQQTHRRSRTFTGITPPPPVVSPVSRSDTTSAASTVYVVRYDHTVTDVPQPIRRGLNASRNGNKQSKTGRQNQDNNNEKDIIEEEEDARPNRNRESRLWNAVPNPFKRKRTSPPQEIQRARAAAGEDRALTPSAMKNRLGALAAETGERFRDRRFGRNPSIALPVTVIPAQPRGSGRTWSPDEHAIVGTPAPVLDATANTTTDMPPSSGGTTSTTLTANDQDPTDGRALYSGATPLPHPATATGRTVMTPGREGPPRADDISPRTVAMSLFGDDPDAPSSNAQSKSKSSLFDDEAGSTSKTTLSSIFADNTAESNDDSPWGFTPSKKSGGRGSLVKSLLADADMPDLYVDTFDALQERGTVSRQDCEQLIKGSGVSAGDQSKIWNIIGQGERQQRSEFSVFLALVGLAKEGEELSLDAVDERRRKLPVLSLPNMQSNASQALPPATPTKQPEVMAGAESSPEHAQKNGRQPSFGAGFGSDPWASPEMHKGHGHLNGVGATHRTTSSFTTNTADPGESADSYSNGQTVNTGSVAGSWGGTTAFAASNAGGFGNAAPSGDEHGFGDEGNGSGTVRRTTPQPRPAVRSGTDELVTVNLLDEKEGMFLFQHRNYEVASIRRNSKVIRRYSDFVWLLDCLHKRYPFRQLPLLPPKRVAINGNHIAADQTFLEKRRRGLARFVNALVRHPILREEQLVVMFLTVPTELAVWRKQATISVQEEFVGRSLPPSLEDSLPQNLQDTFDTVRSGAKRSADLYINLCNLVERVCKRKEGIAAEYGRLNLNLITLTETSNNTYAIDTNDVPLLNEGIKSTAKHIATSQTLLEDEARAWDEGVLEDLKTMRDSHVSMRDMFDRRDRYAKDNIPQLEKRIQQNEQKLQNIRNKGDAAKPGEADKVSNAITADKQSIVEQHARGVFIKECVRDELLHFQNTQYTVSRLHQDWAQERVKYSELQADNFRGLVDSVEGMPQGD
ncbi:Sorting nexin mvp1 [Fulvia fulva]|nr:Sorting nexin mvp1 [Fulvia fulva]KAK4633451.1 Sorting nexin mvp1 [Fulvia fulva]WPV11205.1 Sorting nexin mvp1 [Fulvia fulva]WPV26413.1 Sorting nexin mvp1 [Fulvia fulva]